MKNSLKLTVLVVTVLFISSCASKSELNAALAKQATLQHERDSLEQALSSLQQENKYLKKPKVLTKDTLLSGFICCAKGGETGECPSYIITTDSTGSVEMSLFRGDGIAADNVFKIQHILTESYEGAGTCELLSTKKDVARLSLPNMIIDRSGTVKALSSRIDYLSKQTGWSVTKAI